MSEKPDQNAEMFARMGESQRVLMEAQSRALEQFWSGWQKSAASGNALGAGSLHGTGQADQVFAEWWTSLQPDAGHVVEGQSSTIRLLQGLIDPKRWMGQWSDPLLRGLEFASHLPQLADVAQMESKAVRHSKTLLQLRDAQATCNAILAAVWMRAFGKFVTEYPASHRYRGAEKWREMCDHWLDIANAELIETYRTPEYLSAQKRLVRAAAEYRLELARIAEEWSEQFSMPTRTEVDDLHRSVTELKRQMRTLRRQLSDGERKKRETSVRKPSLKRKTP
jgi:hypothetical protein